YRLLFGDFPELFRQVRIPQLFSVEIDDRDTHAMLHFAFAKVVQMRLPMLELFQVFGDMPGEQDVTGIAAVHHSLRSVDPGACNVRPLIHIYYAADRPAMHPHAQTQFGMLLYRATNFEGAFHRRLRAVVENQRHSVPSWD